MGRAQRAIGALAAGLLLAACSSEPEVVAPPEPAPTVAPTPTAPERVALTHRVEAIQVNANDILSKKDGITPSREGMDAVALDGMANALVELLAAHLDDLNLGGPGTLEDVTGELRSADPGVAALLTTQLATEDNRAVAADLLLRIGVDEVPQWATTFLVVTREDDTTARLELVFSTDGDLELLVAGQGDA